MEYIEGERISVEPNPMKDDSFWLVWWESDGGFKDGEPTMRMKDSAEISKEMAEKLLKKCYDGVVWSDAFDMIAKDTVGARG